MDNCSRRRSSFSNSSEYRHKMGRLLARRISRVFSELGYYTIICLGQSNGVDLKVFDKNLNLIIVAEILNWGPTSNLDANQKSDIINNLSKYDCNRVLIYTTMGNEYILEDLAANCIATVKVGYQILAKYYFYQWDEKKRYGRKVDSRETNALLKLKLTQYLELI